jgi:hypothetical protein
MKKSMIKIAVFSLLVAALAVPSSQVFGQEAKPKPAKEKAEKPPPKKPETAPLHGKIAAVDKVAKTIKVGEHTYQITSETKINKAGKPATLDDAAVGEEVGGSYKKTEGGKLILQSLRIGKKPEGGEPKKEKKPKKEAAQKPEKTKTEG